MKKKTIILAVVAVVVAALLLALGIAIGRGRGEPQPPASVSSAAPPPQTDTPPQSTPPQSVPGPSSGSIPYVGPIESPIIGKWEDKDMGTLDYNSYYEFFPDGTLVVTTYKLLDKDYPENWNTKMYEFYFDTWRGQEVLESGYFMGYMHRRVEFYELDGRQAMDIITIMDDNSEYVAWTLLKVEE